MRSIKYLIVGTPRSATAYTAELLSNLGLACGHEHYFKFEQRWRSFLDSDQVVGDATWLAVPFLAKLPAHVRILHQTRAPVDVVRSLLQIQFLDLDANNEPVRSGQRARFTEFAYRHCPQLLDYESTRERAMGFYYHWNKAIDELATERDILRYDIESLGPDRLKQILKHIGLPRDYVSDGMLTAHFETLPRNINAKKREKVALTEQIAWEDLPAEVQELAASYGYGPPGPSADLVEHWSHDLSDAQNHVRIQARRVLQAWRAEQRKLVAQIGALHAKLDQARDDQDRIRLQLKACQRELDEERLCRTQQPPDDGPGAEAARRERRNWVCRAVVGPRVLDAGCGQGARCILVAREGLGVTGLEVDGAAIKSAREALAAERSHVQKRVQFIHGTLFAVELEQASFDTVILAESLTSVTNPSLLLERAMRCLRDEGRLVVSVPLGYDPSPDQVNTFVPWNLLELLSPHVSVASFEVIRDYLCVVGVKPQRGRPPEPVSGDLLTVWKRMETKALTGIQRRWWNEHTMQLCQQLQQTKEEWAERTTQLSEQLQQTKDELRDAQTRLTTVNEVLQRAQAMQVRLAHSNAESRDWALPGQAGGDGRPVQKAGGFLFFCVNGAGLGHLTRALAVARRVRRLDAAMPIYFLSSSQALRVIAGEDMIAYHIPPRSEYAGQLGGNAWNSLLLQNLRMIVEMHRPAVLVYDGVSPYPGLMTAMSELGFVYTTMILRLRHKHDRLLGTLDRLRSFDQLIFPGESGVEVPAKLAALSHRVFDPIIYLDADEMLDRDAARRHFNVSANKKIVYVQLGAGNIDDTKSWIDVVLSVLGQRVDLEVVVAESPISRASYRPRPGVHVLSQYPNSLFFNGFDLAITAAGYNTFHELMHFGLPTVFIPNQKTVTDDQVGRALAAQDASAARVVFKPSDFAGAVAELLQDDVASAMRENAKKLVPQNGAMDVARHLLESTSQRLTARECAAEVGSSGS